MNRQQLVLSSLGLAGAVSVLVAQPARASFIAEVTAVRLDRTPSGIEVILETKDGKPLRSFSGSFGQTLYIDVISTQLRLPGGNEFRQNTPAPGIAYISVTPLDTNSIRIHVVGETGIPTARVVQGEAGLILSVNATPGTTATQPTPAEPSLTPTPIPAPTPAEPSLTPAPTPTPAEPSLTPTPIPAPTPTPAEPSLTPTPIPAPTPAEPSLTPTPIPAPTLPTIEPTAPPPTTSTPPSTPIPSIPPPTTSTPPSVETGNDPIEIIVTATRTRQNIQNVPRSITTLDTAQIEQQTTPSRNLSDNLGNTVPGLGAPNQLINSNGQSLRGRGLSVIIDGVPQNTNIQSFGRELRTIDPAAVERIEVIRGANAIYGGQATGGVINITTRRPTGDKLTSTTEVGLNTALTNSDNSFGFNGQHTISGKEGDFDFTGSFSLASSGAFYDAEGDRIPILEAGGDTSRTMNVLAKVGVDFAQTQRLQLSLNHYNDTQYPDVIPDFSVDSQEGRQKARAISVGDINIIGDAQPITRNTIVNLSYTNEDIFGSNLQAQVYYRNNSAVGAPLDFRPFEFYASVGVATSQADTEQVGGRIQIETPLARENKVSLLWGADYLKENNEQTFKRFDPDLFDTSGGRNYRQISDLGYVPYYEYDSLGLFAQLNWEISNQFILNGGVRHERVGLNVDDYTTFNDRDIQGGDRDFSSTVFNVGAVYKPIEQISLFANFSQGFSLPDFATILREPPDDFNSVEDSLEITEPQKVNNYEIGVRGQWNTVQVSLSAFYNTSDLGLSLQPVGNTGRYDILRAPERIHGLEATVDWQPAETWQLGGTFSYVEGEFDDDEDGDYIALNSSRIQPIKITAYLENETLPGWNNRLQALFSGSRDRAFEDGQDGGAIESYVTLDFISSLKIGPGILQIGVQNLLNNQYFPVYSQYLAGFGVDSSNYPGRGRTLTVNYRFDW